MIIELLEIGTVRQEKEAEAKESKSKGTLRGGNVGWMSEDGTGIVGTCPRRAWARMHGFLLENNTSKAPMFQAGHTNEDSLCSLLTSAGVSFKREEEIPISWKTSNGTLVTGRPDIVILSTDGTPSWGVEAKLISSLWTCLDRLQLPDTSHCLQSLHYSTKLGIPWSLLYVNRTNWTLNSDFALGKTPKQGENGSANIEYIKRKKTIGEEDNTRVIEFMEGKSIQPFSIEYPIGVNSQGEMEVKIMDEWYPTFMDWEGIERFYEFVSRMDETGDTGISPTIVNIFGEPKNYGGCKYCPLKKTACSKKSKIGLDELRLLCDNQEALIRKQRGF